MTQSLQHLMQPVTAGIGLRAAHHVQVIATRPPVGWFEIHAENYMGGGAPIATLEAVRRDWPVGVHGVGLSLGSADGIDSHHLERFLRLVERIQPMLVSEHLSWSAVGGAYLNDLLPLPYTEEALVVFAANLGAVQDRLQRPILIENPTTYFRFAQSSIPEAEFLAELVRRTGCGLLCDVNNLHVNCHNHGGDPLAWLAALPAGAVGEIHLAGHHANHYGGGTILIDDHGGPVAPAVWALYEAAVRRFPRAATLVEWDNALPELPVLVAEALAADRRRSRALCGARESDDAVAA